MLLLMASCSVIIGSNEPLAVAFNDEVLHNPEATAGLVAGAFGLGVALGGLGSVGLARRRSLAPVVLAGALLLGLAQASVALLGALVPVIVVLVLVGVGMALILVSSRTLLQRSTEDTALAKVLSIQEGVYLTGPDAGGPARAGAHRALRPAPCLHSAGPARRRPGGARPPSRRLLGRRCRPARAGGRAALPRPLPGSPPRPTSWSEWPRARAGSGSRPARTTPPGERRSRGLESARQRKDEEQQHVREWWGQTVVTNDEQVGTARVAQHRSRPPSPYGEGPDRNEHDPRPAGSPSMDRRRRGLHKPPAPTVTKSRTIARADRRSLTSEVERRSITFASRRPSWSRRRAEQGGSAAESAKAPSTLVPGASRSRAIASTRRGRSPGSTRRRRASPRARRRPEPRHEDKGHRPSRRGAPSDARSPRSVPRSRSPIARLGPCRR